MACQREHRGRTVARRSARLAASAVAVAIAGLAALPAALPAGPAAAAGVTTQAAAAGVSTRARPWIAITSVEPGFVQPNGKVTVSGIVVNPTRAAVTGMTVQLSSSAAALLSRQAMSSYLTAPEPTGLDQPVLGAAVTLPAVPAHGTRQWALTLTAIQLGMHAFGVYPLAAHLANLTGQVSGDRSFLVYWPGKPAARAIKPLGIAWVWPLIDIPQQTPCQTLTSNELAGSVASGGRLNSLLATGQTAAAKRALLTWAIDPALISDVSVMTRPYRVSGSRTCAGGRPERASGAARAWLAGVQAAAAQQDFFTTPYADVDVAAVDNQNGLSDTLKAAFADGRLAAARSKVLGRAQRSTPSSAGPIAWPPGGIANYGVLEALATNHIKIRTVILNSTMMRPSQPVTYTPGAVTTIPSGVGPQQITILLADNTLAQILMARRSEIPGLAPAAYTTPPGGRTQAHQAAAFAKEQWFLAETAMIASQPAPGARSVVVTPPRRWNPPQGMAAALLAQASTAPWLRPTSLASLASAPVPAGQVSFGLPRSRAARGALSRRLLRQVKQLAGKIALLGGILSPHESGYLSTAVDSVESSAWRGGRAAQRRAAQLVRRDLAYVLGQLRRVSIVGSSRVTLGGQNGIVPVSISNGLSHPVTVQLQATAPPADRVSIGKYPNPITVQSKSQRTIKIPVTAAQAGSATLTLRLATPSGQLLPVGQVSLIVAATHFGTLAIVIITIALVVFVLTAATRAIRRGSDPEGGAPGAGPADEPGREMADEPGREMADEPGGGPADEPGGEVADEGGREMADEPGGEAADEGGREMADEPGREMADEPGREMADEAGGEAADEPGREMADEAGREMADEPGREAEDQVAGPSPADQASSGGEPDSVVPGGADERQPAKEADEHASTPGRAERS